MSMCHNICRDPDHSLILFSKEYDRISRKLPLIFYSVGGERVIEDAVSLEEKEEIFVKYL